MWDWKLEPKIGEKFQFSEIHSTESLDYVLYILRFATRGKVVREVLWRSSGPLRGRTLINRSNGRRLLASLRVRWPRILFLHVPSFPESRVPRRDLLTLVVVRAEICASRGVIVRVKDTRGESIMYIPCICTQWRVRLMKNIRIERAIF